MKEKELLTSLGLEDKFNVYPSAYQVDSNNGWSLQERLQWSHMLDPQMVQEVLDAIRELANIGMPMIVVTHEMEFAKEICSKLFLWLKAKS